MRIKAKQQGFTLIELIVVIVILGILAVTAAPKFMDVTAEGKVGQRNGVITSIRSILEMGHGKSIVANGFGESGTILVDSVHYKIVNGYPSGSTDGDGTNSGVPIHLGGLLETRGFTLTFATAAAGASPLTITLPGAPNCTITVADAAVGAYPVIGGDATCA
ncbi:MAG: MSHA pilin protein MshA [Phenylobacterium sp.]|jgi:MSHA pilin protein MshA